MPRTISEKARRIAPSATLAMDAKAKALKAQGVSVVSFAAGEPDFDTPLPIRDAMKEAMDQNMTRYTPVSGTAELKDAIIHRFEEDHGLHYDPQEIIVSNGAKHSLYTLFQTILDPGDEVIIPTPCWVSYPEMVRMAGGTPIFVEMKKEHGFVPTNGEILAAITPRTKAFLLTSPNNPTGCVWNRKQMENVMQLAIEHDFYIVSDEIYEKLLYTGEKPCSIASLSEEAKAHTLVVNGVSKSYAMTGFRIGYTAGPRDVIKAMTNYQSQSTSAPNSAAQHAAAVALRGDQSCVETMRQAFQQRRDRIVERINAIPGLSCNKPDGAFYVMMDVRPLLGKRLRQRASGKAACRDRARRILPGGRFLPAELRHQHGGHRGRHEPSGQFCKGAELNARIQQKNQPVDAVQIQISAAGRRRAQPVPGDFRLRGYPQDCLQQSSGAHMRSG